MSADGHVQDATPRSEPRREDQAGGRLVDAVNHSRLPDHFKRVASKLAAFADANGGVLRLGLTLAYLADKCRYRTKKGTLSLRTIQKHMHVYEAIGFVLVERPAVFGAGHVQRYTLNPNALANVDPCDPIFRDQQYRRTATNDAPRRLTPAPAPKTTTRVNPYRNPVENEAVGLRLTHCLFDDWDAGTLTPKQSHTFTHVCHDDWPEFLKYQFAATDIQYNTTLIHKCLNRAAYQRLLQGKRVPSGAGVEGQRAFMRARRTGAAPS